AAGRARGIGRHDAAAPRHRARHAARRGAGIRRDRLARDRRAHGRAGPRAAQARAPDAAARAACRVSGVLEYAGRMPPLDTPVRLGVQFAPQHHASYAAVRDGARRLEDMGVDVLFTWDHFFPLSGDPDGTHFESWTNLAAWAEQTERI